MNSKKYNTSNYAIKKSRSLLWIYFHSATESRVFYNFGIIGIILLTYRINVNERKPITALMMSILWYFSKTEKEIQILDSPFVIAKYFVEEVQRNADTRSFKSTPKKERGQYGTYSPKQRFDIEKFAAGHGNSKMVAKYSQSVINRKVSESSNWSFKTAYLKEKNNRKCRLDYHKDSFMNLNLIDVAVHFSLALSWTQNCKHLLTISVFQEVL